MSILEEIIEYPAPSELYHYTSQQGLLGVLSTDSLWATNIHYLNDYTEFDLALNLSRNILNKKLSETKDKQRTKKIKCLLDNLYSLIGGNVYVSSFSQKRDLLSQWRAYEGSVGGFSIGINSSNLITCAKQQGFILVKCVYDEVLQEKIISEFIDECLAEEFNTISEKFDPNRPRTLIILRTGGEFNKKLVSIAPIIKHRSFSEEDEWRLISSHGIKVDSLLFRPGVSLLTPYFEFQLGNKATYLKSITVGPNPHPELAKEAVQMLLAKYGISQSTEIYDSEIPFRNW